MNEGLISSSAGDTDERRAMMAQRSAAVAAAFCLPLLRPGLRLLDCGCGPGSISLDLAEVVSPGEVVGVDVDPAQISRARALAEERGVANVRFELGDAYELAFPEASFDFVFANQVLLWLSDPLRALKEFRRVLRPGGIVALRTIDPSVFVMHPNPPPLEEMSALIIRAYEQRGASTSVGHELGSLLLDAGFSRSKNQAAWGDSEPPLTFFRRQLEAPGFRETVLAKSWSTMETLDAMAGEMKAWQSLPEAFGSVLFCETLGWVD